MEIINFLDGKLTDGDYLTVCNLLMKEHRPLMIKDVIDNISERMNTIERGAGYYTRLKEFIDSVIEENLLEIHFTLQHCLLGHPVKSIRETVLFGLKELHPHLRITYLF